LLLAPRNKRSLVQVESPELVHRGGREGVAGQVVDDGGEAADVAGGVEDAGLFLAAGAEAEEFHGGEVRGRGSEVRGSRRRAMLDARY
jgi:hypothetical protein